MELEVREEEEGAENAESCCAVCETPHHSCSRVKRRYSREEPVFFSFSCDLFGCERCECEHELHLRIKASSYRVNARLCEHTPGHIHEDEANIRI